MKEPSVPNLERVKGVTITIGDVMQGLKSVPDETYTAILADPPYGLSEKMDAIDALRHWMDDKEYEGSTGGFMDQEWDSFVPGPKVWKELLRTSKPGAILMVYCGTKTSDLMSIALRLAGWEKNDEIDIISWTYATGMPRSTNISKFLDKRAGVEGKVIKESMVLDIRNGHGREYGHSMFLNREGDKIPHVVREPGTEMSKTWSGYGTALAPSHEIVLVFKKPSKKASIDSAVEHGSGAINVAGSVIKDGRETVSEYELVGTWPRNTIVNCCGDKESGCDCPLERLDGKGFDTEGSVRENGVWKAVDGERSRFFFVAKPSRGEKNAGVSYDNNHATIKPIIMNQYLATMLLPPEEYLDKAILAVPFSGVGSEMIGAMLSGWRNIHGFEISSDYVTIAIERLSWWKNKAAALETNNVKKILEKRNEV